MEKRLLRSKNGNMDKVNECEDCEKDDITAISTGMKSRIRCPSARKLNSKSTDDTVYKLENFYRIVNFVSVFVCSR